MSKIFEFSFQWLDQIADKINFLAVFLLSVADRVTLFLIPSEVVVPFAGFLASQGRFGFWSVLVIITMGALVGEALLFWFSIKAGRLFFEKYGKYFFVSKHDLDHVEQLFQKHGGKVVFWGRIIPVARMLIAIPAGIAKMKFGRFIFYTLLGMLPYNLALLYLGFLVGGNRQLLVETTHKYFGRFDIYGVIILAGLIIWYIVRHQKKKHLTHE
ncbi:MAG: hypothetical protein G01um101444_295 [Parcubacteria group bacterium Gr01-1014_44]|nr:MAG: hypothetical protein G01um101444_295 [Parcubacteria group bacterium Gr01-1014_44]